MKKPDLTPGVSDDHMGDIETLLMKILAKFKKAQTALDPEVIARAVHHLEQTDEILHEDIIKEAFGSDRELLVSQVQALGKRIALRAPFSTIPTNSMAVMVSNLQAIAKKFD